MSLGGWTWSTYFSNAALTAESRRAFAASCIDLFIKGNLPKLSGEPQGGPGAAAGVFDGIDIDWEWPASQGEPGNVVRPEDKQNFTLLLAELRRQLDEYGQQTGQHYLLTAFLPGRPGEDPRRYRGRPGVLARKADYIKQRGLGGSMMWSLDGDDAQASLTSALDAALR